LRIYAASEIGDPDFPLEADLRKGIERSHPHIGKNVTVNKNANEVLKAVQGKHGIITGVIIKRGQIAGYEVSIAGKRYYAPRKDFYVRKQYVEDVHLNSSKAHHIREVLNHWSDQHDYYGPAWDGIEAFHFELAKATPSAAIESAGWYKYRSSGRKDMDGKDWRLAIPDNNSTTVVNCHSLLHDAVWTLSTTVYSTREINQNQLHPVGDKDHWIRTFLWTVAVAKSLQTHGFDYSGAISDLIMRMRSSDMLRRFGAMLLPHISAAYQQVTGRQPIAKYVSYGFSKIRLKPGTVGKYDKPTDNFNYGIISVHPMTIKDPKYVFEIVKHELIHHVLENVCCPENDHDATFKQIAEIVKLPAKYHD